MIVSRPLPLPPRAHTQAHTSALSLSLSEKKSQLKDLHVGSQSALLSLNTL